MFCVFLAAVGKMSERFFCQTLQKTLENLQSHAWIKKKVYRTIDLGTFELIFQNLDLRIRFWVGFLVRFRVWCKQIGMFATRGQIIGKANVGTYVYINFLTFPSTFMGMNSYLKPVIWIRY